MNTPSDSLTKTPNPAIKHVHTLKKYKQTLESDNDKFDGQAYFVVQACDECKMKRYIDYKVTK